MRVGIVGAGQLCRMMILEGKKLGVNFVAYQPSPSQPCAELCPIIEAEYTEGPALDQFLDQVDVVTVECEQIPVAFLKAIDARAKLLPNLKSIETCQDRLLEKTYFQNIGFETAPYKVIDTREACLVAGETLGWPIILKKRLDGYDGKAQWLLKKPEALAELSDDQCINCLAEAVVDFDREVSMVGCRDADGAFAAYDLCENIHRNAMLTKTIPLDPSRISEHAQAILHRVMDHLNYVGVMTIEFFQIGDQLVINEAAPRVHNSGHWTIEGAKTSQFENHVRAVVGLPLGSTQRQVPVIMHNILSTMPKSSRVLADARVTLHDYRKSERAGRKLGHITTTEPDAELESALDQLLA